jgi:hypothetical protein
MCLVGGQVAQKGEGRKGGTAAASTLTEAVLERVEEGVWKVAKDPAGDDAVGSVDHCHGTPTAGSIQRLARFGEEDGGGGRDEGGNRAGRDAGGHEGEEGGLEMGREEWDEEGREAIRSC